jgi:hypothetical protein
MPLTIGIARNAPALLNGLGVAPKRSNTSAPSVPASAANRVCIHGSKASAAPCQNHGATRAAPLATSRCAR